MSDTGDFPLGKPVISGLRMTHAVYPDGPPCNPNCPGEHSMYHDGYADGYENALFDVRPESVLSNLRSHAFPNCELCGSAVDDPEAIEYCEGPVVPGPLPPTPNMSYPADATPLDELEPE